jgi:hypothetical protein
LNQKTSWLWCKDCVRESRRKGWITRPSLSPLAMEKVTRMAEQGQKRKCPCGASLLPGKGPRKWCPECQAKREAERSRDRKRRAHGKPAR